MTDLAALTDADLDALRLAVLLEQERRNLIAQAPAAASELATRYAAAIGRKDGDPYQPVTGAHDAYRPGSVVSDGDDYYRATAWASHPPGQGPWERVWADGDGWASTPPADQVEAWDPKASYRRPSVVIHKGKTWDLVHTNSDPGWEPGVVPGVWAARV